MIAGLGTPYAVGQGAVGGEVTAGGGWGLVRGLGAPDAGGQGGWGGGYSAQQDNHSELKES